MDEIAEQTRAGGGALYAVELPDVALVGSIGLFPPHEGVGEIGYWTSAPHRGRGHRGQPADVALFSRLPTDPPPTD